MRRNGPELEEAQILDNTVESEESECKQTDKYCYTSKPKESCDKQTGLLQLLEQCKERKDDRSCM